MNVQAGGKDGEGKKESYPGVVGGREQVTGGTSRLNSAKVLNLHLQHLCGPAGKCIQKRL